MILEREETVDVPAMTCACLARERVMRPVRGAHLYDAALCSKITCQGSTARFLHWRCEHCKARAVTRDGDPGPCGKCGR